MFLIKINPYQTMLWEEKVQTGYFSIFNSSLDTLTSLTALYHKKEVSIILTLKKFHQICR